MSKIKVFVSSTVEDLKNERRVIKETLNELLFDTFLSEYESADVMTPSEVCLSQLKECDVFILIVGREYGYVPKADSTFGSPYDGKISVTHGEFLTARELRKPVIVFVKNTPREPREERFLASLSDFLEGLSYTEFKTGNELREKLLEAIPTLLVRLVRHKYMPPWKWKPHVIIVETPDEVARIGAKILGFAIQNRPNANVGLFAGRTARDIYFKFFQEFNADQMKNIITTRFFSVTEHFGISPRNPNSYSYWFHQAFFNNIKEIWKLEIPEDHKKLVPSSIERDTMKGFRIWYDQYLQINKVDIQLISPAPNGQIVSIDPNYCSLEEMLNTGTSLVRYSKDTSNYLVPVSPHEMDIVIGMRNLLGRSERLVILAHGLNKKDVVRRMILGPVGSDCPASLVSRYPKEDNLLFVIDKKSSEGLPQEIYKHVKLIQPDKWSVIW